MDAHQKRGEPKFRCADSANDEERRFMLTSPTMRRERSTERVTNASYGSVNSDSSNLIFNNKDVFMIRKSGGRGSTNNAEPRSREFPTVRARVVVLLVIFFYTVSDTSSSLDVQYYRTRFSSEFYNTSETSSTGSSSSSTGKCITNSSDPSKKVDDALQKTLSRFQMFLKYMSIGPMLISTIFFGAISDVIGRRCLIILPVVTVFITQGFMLFVIWFDIDVHYLYIKSAVEGSTGGGYLLLIGVFASTADITTAGKKRTFAIVLLECTSFLGTITGSLVTGYLVQDFGFFYSSLFPFAFKAANAIMVLFCLPETVPEQVRGIRPGCVNPCRYLKNIFGFYVSFGSKRQRAMFCVCLACLLCVFIAGLNHTTFLTMYELDQPFCWNPEQLGYYSAASSSTKALLGLLAVHIMQKYFSDAVILIMCLISLIGQFVFEGLAQNTIMLYIAFVAGIITSAIVGVNRALLSKMAASEKQGALFGSIAIVETASDFMSSTLYNTLYEATISTMSGAVFLIMAGLTSLGIIFMLVFIRLSRKNCEGETYEKLVESETTTNPTSTS